MFAWLALVALLSNSVLPAVLAVGVAAQSADHDAFRLGFCSTAPGRDLPEKGRPKLLVHHCALCAAVPDMLPPGRPPTVAIPFVVIGDLTPPRRATTLDFLFRNYRTQPRAPPTAA